MDLIYITALTPPVGPRKGEYNELDRLAGRAQRDVIGKGDVMCGGTRSAECGPLQGRGALEAEKPHRLGTDSKLSNPERF